MRTHYGTKGTADSKAAEGTRLHAAAKDVPLDLRASRLGRRVRGIVPTRLAAGSRRRSDTWDQTATLVPPPLVPRFQSGSPSVPATSDTETYASKPSEAP